MSSYVTMTLIVCTLNILSTASRASHDAPVVLLNEYSTPSHQPLENIIAFTENDELLQKTCDSERETFAIAAANATFCAVNYSHPISVCRHCLMQYDMANRTYYSFKNRVNGTCHQYFHMDQLGIVDMMYSTIYDLWNKSFCKNCYADGDLSNETVSFFKMQEAYSNCMGSLTKGDFEIIDNTTCDRCRAFYKNVTSVYDGMVEKFGTSEVCMDVVDGMNITKHVWEDSCHTKTAKVNPLYSIITAALVAMLSVVFYTTAKFISAIEDVKLFHPKRRAFPQDMQR